MINFRVLKKSRNSRARYGILETPHGIVKTPTLVPVATQAVIKTLNSKEVLKTGTQILICNTFHLHLKPGEKIIKNSGGLHKFMNWQKPLMTDSGGFQVFSLGFGKDFGIGKIAKYFPGQDLETLESSKQPKEIKITDDGVWFHSPINGKKLFLGPKESIKIQEDLGADIIFAFDECTPPNASYEYAKKSLERTHKWAKICLEVKKTKQALFGIVQGSHFKDLRMESAKFINSLDFDGFGIGGEFGYSKTKMVQMINLVNKYLFENKPRHLLGVGKLEDIEIIIKSGIDLFDCTVPTQYARRGIAFVSKTKPPFFRKINIPKSKFLKDQEPLDKNCECFVCQNYKRNYLCHLFRAKEITGMSLLTFHNLYFFNKFVKEIREKIKNNKL